MHKECAACGEDFEREPGFYFGAAYVSYALTVALWVAVLVAMMAFDAWGWMEFGMFTHPGTYLTTGMHAAAGLDAGDLQVEPFHLGFDVHENPGMKKGPSRLSVPFKPNRLIHCAVASALTKTETLYRARLQKVTPQAKKNLHACFERSLSASSPCTRMLSSCTDAKILRQEIAAESHLTGPIQAALHDVSPACHAQQGPFVPVFQRANLTGEGHAFVEHVQQLLVHAVDLKSQGVQIFGRRRSTTCRRQCPVGRATGPRAGCDLLLGVAHRLRRGGVAFNHQPFHAEVHGALGHVLQVFRVPEM